MGNNFKKLNKEQGVSLIITFFVMIIILAVVLSISTLLYSEIKIIRNMSGSVVSFYAADSGVEKVLYYDRKMMSGETRGLCSICSNCSADGLDDKSLYCVSCQATSIATTGCDPAVCNDCIVTFSTIFDGPSSESKKYNIKATISPDLSPYTIEISSSGFFNNVGRAINVLSK